MYTPKHFDLSDLALARTLIKERPLAMLVCPDAAGANFVSHLPMRADGEGGEGESWWLEGHMARANPHAPWLAAQSEVLAVFTGPDGYISPRLYDTLLAVPTWNYLAVHVYGRLELIDEAAAKDSLLKRLIGEHDPDYIAQWNELPEDFKSKLLGAIIGFRIRVTRWEGKAKLSQNRAATERERILAESDPQMQEWLARVAPR
ncbi:MAG TPA: FMN-binding negative transcriptional regulator [Burkholderiaceae bacterium]|jgi:transcriptional regulator